MGNDGKVVIPDNAVAGNSDPDLLQPLQTLLQGLNLLGEQTADTGDNKPADANDPGAQALESTATTVAKIGAPIVAALGGLTAIGSTIASFASTSHDSVRIAALASSGAVIVAAVLGFAYIVGTDLQSRSRSTVAIYDARRAIGHQFLQEVLAASKDPAQQGAVAASGDVEKQADTTKPDADTVADAASLAPPSSSAPPSPSAAVVALAAAGAKAQITRVSDQANGHLAGLRCADKVEVRWIDAGGSGTWTDPSDINVESFTF
jgi:hypothetical protein